MIFMETIVLLCGIIAYLGVNVGAVLGMIAPEEIRPGKRYILFALHLMMLLSVVGQFFVIGFDYFTLIIAVSLVVLMIISMENVRMYYLFGGSTLIISSLQKEALFVNTLVVFMMGIFLGSLFMLKFIRDRKLPYKRCHVLKELNKDYCLFLIVILVGLFVRFLINYLK